LPALFGPGRNIWDDLTDLKVETESRSTHDLVLLRENSYYPFSILPIRIGQIPMLMASPMTANAMAKGSTLAKASDMIYPYARDSLTLRLSGQYNTPMTARFRVSGLWGGLRFSIPIQVSLPHFHRAGFAGASLWAYQQGEAWGRGIPPSDPAALQKLGHDYHVVNNQVSLLALEPGTALWDYLPTTPNPTASSSSSIFVPNASGISLSSIDVTARNVYPQNFLNLDSLTLEDLLSDRFGSPVSGGISVSQSELKIRAEGKHILISWLGTGSEASMRFEILDLAGRKVVSLPAIRAGDSWAASWDTNGRRGGFYAVARQGNLMTTRRFAVVR